MLLPNGAFAVLLIRTTFFGLSAASWVLSNFHVFNLPEHQHEPVPSTKNYQLVLDDVNWVSLSLSSRDVLKVVKEGRVFFTIFRRDSPVFSLPIDWYQGSLHSGSLDRLIRVNPGDQLLLLADKTDEDLSLTLSRFDQIVRREYGPDFDLTRCLVELLTVYPSLNRLRFVFATVMPEDEARDTIYMFSPQEYTYSEDPFSWTLRVSSYELNGTVSSSSSWSYQKRPETMSSSSSSDRTCTDNDVSSGETESVQAKPDSAAFNLLVSDWHPQTDCPAGEEGSISPIPESFESPVRNHRARKYRPRACVIC